MSSNKGRIVSVTNRKYAFERTPKFAERLEVMQRTLGINNRQLADKLEISPSYLSEIKSGRSSGTGVKLWKAVQMFLPEWQEYLAGASPIIPGTKDEEKFCPYCGKAFQEENEDTRHVLKVDDPLVYTILKMIHDLLSGTRETLPVDKRTPGEVQED